jgi:propionyl-CoA synthetase
MMRWSDECRRAQRGTVKRSADNEPWTMPATIDDPAILDGIGEALKGQGVGE